MSVRVIELLESDEEALGAGYRVSVRVIELSELDYAAAKAA